MQAQSQGRGRKFESGYFTQDVAGLQGNPTLEHAALNYRGINTGAKFQCVELDVVNVNDRLQQHAHTKHTNTRHIRSNEGKMLVTKGFCLFTFLP